MMRRLSPRGSFLALVCCATVAVTLSPGSAQANLVGPIFSGPTSADPMVVYWNPAAMTLLSRTSGMLFGGVTAIATDYDRTTPSAFDGSAFATAKLRVPRPELGFGLVSDLGLSRVDFWKRLRFGVGMAIPVLDGATWDLTYDGKPSSSRYFGLEARQVHILIRPAIAFEVSRHVSVGIGLDIYPVMMRQAVMIDFGARVNQLACAVNETQCLLDAPLPREDPTYDGLSVIDGAGVALGISAGLLVSPARWLRLGLTVQSGGGATGLPVEIEVGLPEAVADFIRTSLPSVRIPELKASGEIIVDVAPLTLIAGASWLPTEKLEFEALFHFTRKSKLSILIGDVQQTSSKLISDQVLIRSFTDDWHVGLRGSYRVLPSLRVGLRSEYDPSSRTERFFSPVSLDFDKIQIEFGLAWQVRDWLRIYAEYAHFFFFPVEIDESSFAPNAQPTTPEASGLDRPHPLGRYDGQANRVAVGLLFAL